MHRRRTGGGDGSPALPASGEGIAGLDGVATSRVVAPRARGDPPNSGGCGRDRMRRPALAFVLPSPRSVCLECWRETEMSAAARAHATPPNEREEDQVNQDRERLRSEAELIGAGKAVLGIEFGSTRIKASLIASGRLAARVRLPQPGRTSSRTGSGPTTCDDVWKGLAGCYASLVEDVRAQVRGRAEGLRRPGRQRDDARVHRPGPGGQAPGPVPDLAQQHHRQGLRRADAALRLRRPAALEHRPPLPVDPRGPAARCRGSPTSPPWPATSTGG